MSEGVGKFIWCDLSAYRPEEAMDFYGKLLGWRFEGDAQSYYYASSGADAVAGIFDMPAFFRKINMPSFWMSYIQVASVDAAVATATTAGGKVELEDQFGDDGRIALIRDPLGAGFTVYEGAMQPGASGANKPGLRAGHSLHIFRRRRRGEPSTAPCSAGEAENWNGARRFLHPDGHSVAEIYESTSEERGGFEYWGVAFSVSDLDAAEREIAANGGKVFRRADLAQGEAIAAADMDDAAFFAVQAA